MLADGYNLHYGARSIKHEVGFARGPGLIGHPSRASGVAGRSLALRQGLLASPPTRWCALLAKQGQMRLHLGLQHPHPRAFQRRAQLNRAWPGAGKPLGLSLSERRKTRPCWTLRATRPPSQTRGKRSFACMQLSQKHCPARCGARTEREHPSVAEMTLGQALVDAGVSLQTSWRITFCTRVVGSPSLTRPCGGTFSQDPGGLHSCRGCQWRCAAGT